MKINWKVRVKNKAFWLALIPAVLLVAQAVAAPFGYALDFTELNAQLAAIVNAVFVLRDTYDSVCKIFSVPVAVQRYTPSSTLGFAVGSSGSSGKVEDSEEMISSELSCISELS